MLYKNIFIGDI